MYPSTSNFQSAEPGSAWVAFRPSLAEGSTADTSDPGKKAGDLVLVSQWDALVRVFQKKARTWLPSTWSINLQTGMRSGGTQRSADSVQVTGRWDQITYEALLYLVSALENEADAAQYVLKLVSIAPTADKPEFPIDLVWLLIGYAIVIPQTALPIATREDETRVLEASKKLQTMIFPGDVTLPTLGQTATSPPADQEWFAEFNPQTQPVPVPPSRQPAGTGSGAGNGNGGIVTVPQPGEKQEGLSTGMKIGLAVLGIGAIALLMSNGSSDGGRASSRGTRQLPEGEIELNESDIEEVREPRGNPSHGARYRRKSDTKQDLRAYGERLGAINRVPEIQDLRARRYTAADAALIRQVALAKRRQIYGS